ncbi:alpha/beta hydrolase [Nocardia sp. NPDC088792]|uniref:alpha/beta hydrolase n=1 Tax=Nocardia sp. NPDC088792 TaxID=3364332 RepID=UPI0037FD9C91
MGGITIQAWALRYREQVAERASAVLLAATAARKIPTRSTILPILDTRFPGRVLEAEAIFGAPVPIPGTAAMHRLFKSCVMSRNASADQVDFVLSIVRSCSPRVRAATARVLVRLDLGDAAANLSVPTSVIAGEFDRLLPRVHSEEITAALDKAGTLDRFTMLPTGHTVNIEAPEAFNTELTRVIQVGAAVSRGLRKPGITAS